MFFYQRTQLSFANIDQMNGIDTSITSSSFIIGGVSKATDAWESIIVLWGRSSYVSCHALANGLMMDNKHVKIFASYAS
jgi:hypothetical protein